MAINDSLDLEPFEKAVHQLEKSWEFYHNESKAELKEQFRAATIQAFEYNYELAFKIIKRYLVRTATDVTEIDSMSFNELIRTACEKNLLLNDLRIWSDYREKRNMTTHTYEEANAELVVSIMPMFIEEIKYLLKELNERNQRI